MKFDSRVVRGCQDYSNHLGSVSVPIYQTSTYVHKSAEDMSGYDYTRCQNPTREELETTIAALESGTHGFAFTTGLAANMAVFSLLSAGDHAVVSDDIYGGTYRLIETIFKRFNVDFTFVDPSDHDAIQAAVQPNTKLFFIETPTNPMMKVADIQRIADIAHKNNAVLTVDNTFLTPFLQRPLELGADIVLHSGTKFLAGHNDTMAGLVVVKDAELAENFRNFVKTEGSGLAPFDSFLLLRGIKTLSLRMKKHEENAMAVAKWLEKQPKVEKVYFVGLPDSNAYDVTLKQTSGFGGMISFAVDSVETARQILRKVEFILFAESLGGTETLITYPMTQTHASIPEDIRNRIGITDKLLRLSVGIEDVEDIIADLEQALC